MFTRLLSIRVAIIAAVVLGGGMLALAIKQETPIGSLKGKAVAQETGNPLSAQVELTALNQKNGESSSFSTMSKNDGSFGFNNVPAGAYTLQINSRAHLMAPVQITIEEGKTKTVEAELSPGAPSLDLYIHQHVYTPDELAQVTVKGFVDSDSIDLKIYKVDMDSFLVKYGGSLGNLLGVDSYYSDSGTETNVDLSSKSSLKLSQSFLTPVSTRDAEGIFNQRINLPSLSPGLYVTAVKAGSIQKLGWVMVTSLGLVTKTVDQQVLAYTVDLKSGAPVPGTSVDVLIGSNVAASGKTGSDGLLKLAVPSQKSGESQQTIIAREGESVAFVSAEFSSTESSDKLIYAYTERPVYRPGQMVFYKGIVRQPQGDGYKVPVSIPVTVEVRDSRDTLIYRAKKTTDKFGCYSGHFPLNPETTTGYYTLVSGVPNGGRGNEINFQVAAYRKPEFSVKASFTRKRYTRGDTMHAKISTAYYFGAPVANAKVNYTIYRAPYWLFGMDEDMNLEDGYEDYGGYGEYVNDGTVVTDENGEAEVEIPAQWPMPKENDGWDSDQKFTIDLNVTDKSDREATGNAYAIVTRGEFAIDLTTDRYIVTPGSSVNVSVQAMDYDRHPIRNQRMSVVVGREIWSNEEIHFQEESERGITTDNEGRAAVRVPITKPGDTRIIAKCRDSRGNQISEAAYVWAYSSAYEEDENAHYPDLKVITDKKTYNPGDTAKVLINVAKPGATALVTVEGDRIYDQRTVKLNAKSTIVEIPVKAEYKPNFYISVCFVKNKEFTEQQARVKVSIKAQSLKISIKPNKRRYKPGEMADYKIRVTDHHGRPQSAELSVGVVDEAIYAIAEDETPAMLGYFYSEKYNRVQTNFSFPRIYLSDPDKAGKPLTDAERRIRVRKRFLDTAFWNPSVITDGNGEAQVRFRMPDNLTTWRTTVRGITTGTACGEAINTVIARQNLMVRLEMPRFLVQTDSSTLSAVIHNYTGKDQSINVRIDAPGLRLRDGQRRSIFVRNGGSERIDWQVYAPKPGSFSVTVRALGDKVGDAVQLNLPVKPHGEKRQAISTGEMTRSGRLSIPLIVRSDSIPEANRLTIRLAPSFASTLLGSLDYLAQYPYGCTEQTTSSFIPDVVLYRSLNDLGVNNAELKAKLPDMVSVGLFKLYKFQLEDGGWSWCEYGKSDAWMTAYVCYGLIQAGNAGFTVNRDILDDGLRSLNTHLSSEKLDTYTRAYGNYVLALSGRNVFDRLSEIAKRHELNSETLAILSLGFSKLGKSEEAKIALNRLFEQVVSDGSGIHWIGRERYDSSDVEATAMGLNALLKVNPSDPRATRIVRWLMSRRQGDCWYSTRQTAMVLYAMAEYARVSKELQPDYDITVMLNGKVIDKVHFDRESIFKPELELAVRKNLHKGRNRIEIIKNGKGVLYYSTQLTQYIARKTMPTVLSSAGLSVTRTYYRPSPQYYATNSFNDPGSSVYGCGVGDTILVRLVIYTKYTLRHLLLEDYIPAGCEIVDRGNVNVWDWGNWWVGQDIRDDSISFYLDEVYPGKQIVEYQMRGGFTGIYHALPAQVFDMYNPQTRATTDETEFEVR